MNLYQKNMTLRSVMLMLLTFAILAGGCKKKESAADPCDGLLNETPPSIIMVKFVDKATGQNLIVSDNIKSSDITVINNNTGKEFANWRIVSQGATSPFNGMLQFSVFHETAGQYPYQIKLAGFGRATLAYTVSKVATNNLCKPTAYPISNIMIIDHPFTAFTYDGKSYPNILVVEL
ncbi:hypothetical protein [Mucilaginibacter lappiensis]|uniref:hypothetical protein n=1 Tax=Mucilaginibacter lappiensis TaxID=354630 RepID=UPI003D2088FF